MRDTYVALALATGLSAAVFYPTLYFCAEHASKAALGLEETTRKYAEVQKVEHESRARESSLFLIR